MSVSLFAALLIGLLSLAGAAGWVAGLLLQRRGVSLLADVAQGTCGGALCLEVYSLSGPLEHGLVELVLVTVVGAWICVGVAHATAAAIRYLVAQKRV